MQITEIECQIGQEPWTISTIERVCSMVLSGIQCHHEVLLVLLLLILLLASSYVFIIRHAKYEEQVPGMRSIGIVRDSILGRILFLRLKGRYPDFAHAYGVCLPAGIRKKWSLKLAVRRNYYGGRSTLRIITRNTNNNKNKQAFYRTNRPGRNRTPIPYSLALMSRQPSHHRPQTRPKTKPHITPHDWPRNILEGRRGGTSQGKKKQLYRKRGRGIPSRTAYGVRRTDPLIIEDHHTSASRSAEEHGTDPIGRAIGH